VHLPTDVSNQRVSLVFQKLLAFSKHFDLFNVAAKASNLYVESYINCFTQLFSKLWKEWIIAKGWERKVAVLALLTQGSSLLL
jgi:hypothetical protein